MKEQQLLLEGYHSQIWWQTNRGIWQVSLFHAFSIVFPTDESVIQQCPQVHHWKIGYRCTGAVGILKQQLSVSPFYELITWTRYDRCLLFLWESYLSPRISASVRLLLTLFLILLHQLFSHLKGIILILHHLYSFYS